MTWSEVLAGLALFFIIYGVTMILAKCLILIAHSIAKKNCRVNFWIELALIFVGCLLAFKVIW